jgi:hypothetical protein
MTFNVKWIIQEMKQPFNYSTTARNWSLSLEMTRSICHRPSRGSRPHLHTINNKDGIGDYGITAAGCEGGGAGHIFRVGGVQNSDFCRDMTTTEQTERPFSISQVNSMHYINIWRIWSQKIPVNFWNLFHWLLIYIDIYSTHKWELFCPLPVPTPK